MEQTEQKTVPNPNGKYIEDLKAEIVKVIKDRDEKVAQLEDKVKSLDQSLQATTADLIASEKAKENFRKAMQDAAANNVKMSMVASQTTLTAAKVERLDRMEKDLAGIRKELGTKDREIARLKDEVTASINREAASRRESQRDRHLFESLKSTVQAMQNDRDAACKERDVTVVKHDTLKAEKAKIEKDLAVANAKCEVLSKILEVAREAKYPKLQETIKKLLKE